ncbi:MAG: NAD(P)-dependent oxidoreductase [candidate division Zixibacteria bacterium]
MPCHVHLHQDFDDDWIREFTARLDSSITLSIGPDVSSSTNILIAGVPEAKHLEASKALTTLVIPWAGLPKATRVLLKDYPHIEIYNIHHNAGVVAEHAVALMMALARNLIPTDKTFRANDWTPRYDKTSIMQLKGKRALILGYGAIGHEIGKICRTLGMKIVGIKKNHDASEGAYPVSELPVFLPKTNVFFVCLPMTPNTLGMIGKNELSLLPDNAIIINIGRGAIINEEALYNELKSGRLKAGLDVWYQYPKKEKIWTIFPPSKFDFASLENVIMTPHLAGHSDMVEKERIAELAELINNIASGNKPQTQVDINRGY